MEEKTKGPWADFYSADSVKYVHSNSLYFENIVNKTTVLNNLSSDSSFSKNLLSIMLVVLDDHLSFWKQMASLAIKTGAEKKIYGVTLNTSPEEFLKKLNNAHDRLKKSEPVLGSLYEYNEIKILTTPDKSASKLKIEKSKKDIIEKVRDLYNVIANIHNAEATFLVPFLNYLNNAGITDYPSVADVSPNFNRAKEKINEVINAMGAKDIEDLKSIIYGFNISELDPAKNPDFDKIERFYSLTVRQAQEKYLKDWTGTRIDIPQWFGKFLEDVENITFTTDKEFGEKLMNAKDFVPDIGKKLQQGVITDKVVMTASYNEKRINLGTGIKLKSDTNLDKSYEAIDIVFTPYLKSFLGSNPVSVAGINILEWLRVNIQALNVFSADEKINKNIIDKFKDIERKVAGLAILPRFLDGFYNYQQEKLSLEETGGEIYHTAFLLMDGKFYWTYSFLEQIIKDLRSNFGDTSKTTTFSTLNKGDTVELNKIDAVQLERFYLEKLKAIKKLNQISYAALQNNPNVKSLIEDLYLSSLSESPVKRVNTSMKFSTMITNIK